MKILLFNWRCWEHPYAGGSERYIHEISKKLILEGHQITWFVGSFGGAKEREILDEIEIIRKGGRFSVYLWAFWYYLIKLRKRNFDIVIDNINGVPFFTPLFVRKPKIAIIHHLVGWEIFFKELPFYLAPIGFLAEKLISLIYFNTKFITVSESSKNEMEKNGLRNIEIVYNGIDRRLVKINPGKERFPVMIFLGRLMRYKNIDHLIKAFQIVLKNIPETELWIVGEGETKTECQALVKHLGILKKVKFFGFIEEIKKLELLEKAWLFVTPSQKEGWGLTVIEANACKTLAISYNVPGLRDSIQNGFNGFLVKYGDIRELSQKIIEVLKNKDLRKKLSENAYEWSQNFSWDKSAQRFEEIIRQAKYG